VLARTAAEHTADTASENGSRALGKNTEVEKTAQNRDSAEPYPDITGKHAGEKSHGEEKAVDRKAPPIAWRFVPAERHRYTGQN
jgi:hypothetical protein